MIKQIMKSFFFWLPTGTSLEGKKYSVIVWLVLGGVIFYAISQGNISRSIVRQNILTPQFNLVSKYSIGINHLLSSFENSGEESATSLNEINNNLFEDARTSISSDFDKIGLAIFISEIYSKKSALEYLNSLKIESRPGSWLGQEVQFIEPAFNTSQIWQPNPDDQHYIKQKYHWLGELLLSQGQPGLKEVRNRIYERSSNTVVLMIFMVFFAGLVILVRIIIDSIKYLKVPPTIANFNVNQQGPQKIKGRVVLLETVVLFLLFVLISSYVMRFNSYLGLFLYFSSLSTIAWPLFRGINIRELKNILGLSYGEGLFQEIAFGIRVYIRCIPLLIMGLILTSFLVRIFGEIPAHPIIYQFEQGGFLRLSKWIFIACFFAPVVEELIFRGVFFHYLRQQYSFWISAAVSSLIFAMIHPQGYTAIPVIMAISISFSIQRELRKSIVAPITAHIINNSIVAILLLILF